MSKVIPRIYGKVLTIEQLNVTQNGTYDSASVDGYKPVVVNCPVPKAEQEKTINITESKQYTITPDVGKVLSKVIANVDIKAGADISPFKNFRSGSFTVASDISSGEYDTNIPAPDTLSLFIVYTDEEKADNYISGAVVYGSGVRGDIINFEYTYVRFLNVYETNNTVRVSNNFIFTTNNGYILKAGRIYKWILLS